jgi:hypothetical protein
MIKLTPIHHKILTQVPCEFYHCQAWKSSLYLAQIQLDIDIALIDSNLNSYWQNVYLGFRYPDQISIWAHYLMKDLVPPDYD